LSKESFEHIEDDAELTREISLLKHRIRELEKSETHYRKAVEELGSSLQQLRLLIDAGPDFFFLKDLDLTYQLVNAANAQFFGRTEAEIMGKNDYDLMPSEAAIACQQSDRLAITEKRTVIATEPVGARFYETYKFPPGQGQGGRCGGHRPRLTERKLAEEELRRAAPSCLQIENSGASSVFTDRDGRTRRRIASGRK
jgi:PAS domain-containing protein